MVHVFYAISTAVFLCVTFVAMLWPPAVWSLLGVVPVAQLREGRHGGADSRVQIGLRAAPVGAHEPVGAVVRDRNVDHVHGPKHPLVRPDRRKVRAVRVENLGKIIGQPIASVGRVPGQDDHAPPGDSATTPCRARSRAA